MTTRDLSTPDLTTRDAIESPGRVTLPVIAPRHERDVCDVVGDAFAHGTPLRIGGGGTWLDAGRPVTATAILDCSGVTGIVEYVPGDLTLTARAGTTLAELRDAVRVHGQELPLDPFGAPTGTLGATLATASAGPLAGALGRPRDITLGIAFVTGEGRLVRGGGRVVKNVAGFDLVRLAVGAWGTLGVLVEATVRLRARPEADATFALALPGPADALAATLDALRAAPATPLAMELVSPTLAAALGAGDDAAVLVRVAGNADAVLAQRRALARLGATREVDPAIWSHLCASDPPGSTILRVSRRPSALAHLWSTLLGLVEAMGGDAHASVDRGVLRCRLTTPDESGLRGLVTRAEGGGRIFERLPADWWPRLAPPSAADPIERALRDAFDPRRVLNRSILGTEGA